MKYFKYAAPVFVFYWLFSGIGYALDAAGTDRQLQYNNNGTLAGAEIYYYNQSQTLDMPGHLNIGNHLSMDSGDFTITTYPSPEHAILGFEAGPYSFAAIYFHPDRLHLLSYSVSIGEKLGVNIEDPQATLDVNGYAKLKAYSSPPVPCTSSRRGTIVMNNNYDLCVCKSGFSIPSIRRPDSRRGDSRGFDDFYPVPISVYRLVRNPSKKCW